MGLTLETSRSLEKFLQDKVTSLPKVVEAVKRNTAEMQANAQRKAPVDTGTLKRSIYQKVDQEGTRVVGEVGSSGAGSEYEPYQEYGTRFMSAHPHIRPAYYEQTAKFRKDMYEVTK